MFEVEIRFYYDQVYTHSVWYDDVPAWRANELLGRNGAVYDTKWTRKVFIYNKEEVSE